MKRAILLATSLICAARSGVGVKGSLPTCWRNITSMLPAAADTVSIDIFLSGYAF
jgi:hypothetical protein